MSEMSKTNNITLVHLDLGIGHQYHHECLKFERFRSNWPDFSVPITADSILTCDLFCTGGAEQLIVSIGCTLKEMGYTVNILTSHHDCNHCFEETKEKGIS